MRKRYLIAIIITVLLMVIFFFKDHPSNPMASGEANSELDSQTENKIAQALPNSDKVIEKQAADSKTLKDKNALVLSEEQLNEIQKNFSNNIKRLGICLGIQPAVESEKMAPAFDNLATSLKSALGELVVRMDDWAQQDLKYADGTVKRIRTEIEYQDNGNPIKRAQLYKVNEQGMPEMQPLTAAESTDPSDEFLDSLRGAGQPILEEKGGRAYYQEGEELVLVEKNGKLQSFSLTKGEKTFSCMETDATTSNCQCL